MADVSLMSILGTVFGSSLVGGMIGAWIQHRLARRLARESELLVEKRRVYNELARALRIFVGDEMRTAEEKRVFLNTYDTIWLWASDSVINALNQFIALTEQLALGENIPQPAFRAAYSTTVLAMRRDIGFAATEVRESDYHFVEFGKRQLLEG